MVPFVKAKTRGVPFIISQKIMLSFIIKTRDKNIYTNLQGRRVIKLSRNISLNDKFYSKKNILYRTCSHNIVIHDLMDSPKKLNSVRSQKSRCIKNKRYKYVLIIYTCLIMFTHICFSCLCSRLTKYRHFIVQSTQ